MRMSETLFMWPTMFTGQRCPCHQQYSCGKRCVHVWGRGTLARPCRAMLGQLKSPFPEATSTHINLYIDNHKYRGPSRYITHSYPSPPRDAPLLPPLPSLPPARPIPPASTSP